MKAKLLFLLLIQLMTIQTSWSKDKYLDLNQYGLSLLQNRFVVDDVIDDWEEKNCIGYVLTGLQFNRVPTYLSHSLSDYFRIQFSSINNPSLPEHLILRINKLIVYELGYTNNELGIVEMNVSFIIKKGDKFYEKFQSSSVITKIIPDAMGVPSNNKEYLGANIISAMENCVNQYNQRNSTNQIVIDDLQEIELFSNPLENQSFRMQSIERFTKGIYNSFYDFRDNTPDTSIHFSVEYNGRSTNNSRTATLSQIDRNDIQNIWGFSDGKENFVRFGMRFYPITKEGKCYMIYNYPPDFGTVPLDVSWGFGLVGGLLFSTIDVATTDRIKYNLDFSTGRFSPYDEGREFKVEGEIVIYSSDFNKDSCELFVDNVKVCNLTKGSYYAIKYTPNITESNVCIHYKGEQVCSKVTPRLFNSDLCLIKKGNKPILDYPSFNMKQELYSNIGKNYVRRITK